MSKFLSCYKSRWRCAKLTKNFSSSLGQFCVNKQLGNKGTRRYSQESKEDVSPSTSKFVSFLERIDLRRVEAQRSVLVQVQSAQSCQELHSYCSSIGTVKRMFHYTTGVEPMHFIIVEFTKESDIANILSASSYIEENLAVPTQSQFLWFRASNRKLAKLKQSKSVKLSFENGTEVMKDDEIKDSLRKCESVSEQMRTLYKLIKLNDVGTRLRYLTARQIESVVSGIFPYATAYPFGSSVNGYGTMGCDLDLVLRLVDKRVNEDSRLVFHCKAGSGSERTVSQRQMECIGDLIHLFLPGCAQVRRILQARVPIIKYHQQLTDVECDLSMTNMSGVYMSDFLYMMGELDDRVRPLVFAVRKWAKEVGLTNASPGRWITNFSLTLLVLAFLQRPLNSAAILPSLNTLTKLAGPNDQYITEDGISGSFLRDLNKFGKKSSNTETLESLLREFFEYYSQFDFTSKAVCLNEAIALTKPEFSAMYIVNPLERGLNVSKNVSLEEVERFKLELRNAAWVLESQENKAANWGLLSILENKKKLQYNFNFSVSSKQGRLMEVSTLFEEQEKEKQEVVYKNETVKRDVINIKKDTQAKINTLKQQNSQR